MEIPSSKRRKWKIEKDKITQGIAMALSVGVTSVLYYSMQNDSSASAFILKPVTAMVQWLVGLPFQYIEGVGYVNPQLGICIGSQCSGVHFLTILFLMLIISFISKAEGISGKIKAFVGFALVAYGMTLIANVSRIVASIFILSKSPLALAGQDKLLHLSIGVMFYFTYMLLTFWAVKHFIDKKGVQSHETSL